MVTVLGSSVPFTVISIGSESSGTALAGAVLVRYVFDPWMGDTLPLVTLFGAVAAASCT